MEPRLLFNSSKRAVLHAVSAVAFVPAPVIAWLIVRAPRTEWEALFGATWWWLVPAGLIGLALVLPAAMFWLHDRYVLRLERSGEVIRLTTFLLWGRRVRELPLAFFAAAEGRYIEGKSDYGSVSVNAPYWLTRLRDGRRLILDATGDAPEGWQVLRRLWGVR